MSERTMQMCRQMVIGITATERHEFLAKLYKAAYKGRCLLVGFNLPFDLSRIAFNSTSARGRFVGAFTWVVVVHRQEWP